MAGEVAARAMPTIIFKSEVVAIVVAPEAQAEIGEYNPLRFLGVALSLFNLANETRIHSTSFQLSLADSDRASCKTKTLGDISPSVIGVPNCSYAPHLDHLQRRLLHRLLHLHHTPQLWPSQEFVVD